MKRNPIATLYIPLIIVVIVTIIFRYTNLDISISALFYSSDNGFYMKNTNPWQFLYDYGNIPPLGMAICGLILFILSFFAYGIRRYRKTGLFMIIFMIIAPGLIVNTVFKDHYGRPRPRQIVQFSGEQNFLPLWDKGEAGEGKSFPSGHAAVGFYLFAPFFFLWGNTDKRWGLLFLMLGIGYGLLMGIGRIIQGAHFPSDVLWSGAFLYFIGILLYWIFRFDKGLWSAKA